MPAHASEDAIDFLSADARALAWDEGAQDFVVDPEKAGVKWGWNAIKSANVFPITLTAGQAVEASCQILPDAPFELSKALLTSTGRISVQISLPEARQKLSNVPISSNLFFGNSMFPALFAQTLLMQPQRDWLISIRDLSNLANSVSGVFEGRRFLGKRVTPELERATRFGAFMYPYVLGPSRGTLTLSGGTASAIAGGAEITLVAAASCTLRFDSQLHFDCFCALDDSTQANGLEPNLTAQIFVGDVPLNDVAISWRDFLAVPTVNVTGLKAIGGSTGGIAAASVISPGFWTHLFQKGVRPQIVFTNANAGGGSTITLRVGFGGVVVDPSLAKKHAS